MRKYFDSENTDLEIFMDLQFLRPLNINIALIGGLID
jgi:hypothetical protein